MPVDVLTLPPSSINTKWKEPYASASLNAKLVGVIAPGIYRGLRLIPDPSLGDRTVVVQADADRNDHVAVYESDTGYSVTYRDSASGDITISLASYASVNVVVCVFITYAIGVTTAGSYRAYTEAEFTGLSSTVRDHLVVLGTVAVPASGAIPSGNITLLRRTLASSNFSSGAILNAPLVRNADFEVGETNATHARSSLFWDKSVTVGTGSWKTDAITVDSGMKSIELNVTAGPITGELSQQIGVQTLEGQLFLVLVRVKQLKTVTSGSIVFFMEWSDVNDALLSTTTQTLDGGGVDSSFRTIETIIPAPAGAASLRTVGVRVAALSPSTTGVFGYIDGVNVDVEPVDAQHPYPFDQSFRRTLAGTSLSLLDKTGNFTSQLASLRFDPTLPASEGRVLVEPGNPSNLPPALGWLGRLYKLGASLLATEANALKPRIEADTSVATSTEYTLMWESAREGELPGGYTQPVVRMYTAATGAWLFTVNATWASTAWNKDIGGQEAFKIELKKDQFGVFHQAGGTNPWADGAWLSASTMINGTMNLFLGNAASQYIFEVARLRMKMGTGSNVFDFSSTALTHAADIIPLTSGQYKIGSGTSQVSKLWSRGLSLGVDPTDYPVNRSMVVKGEFAPWDGEYLSRHFGIFARKGSRFMEDFFSATTLPDGWTTSSLGSGNVANARDGTVPHTLVVSNNGSAVGSIAVYTSQANVRLTNNFLARFRVKWEQGFSEGWFGLANPPGLTNGISIYTAVDNITSGGPYTNTAFRIGGTLSGNARGFSGGTVIDTLTGTNGFSQSPGAVYQWYTFGVIGSALYWSIHTTEPDTALSDIDSGVDAPFGSAAITVPTGLFVPTIMAQGSGLGFGSTMRVDCVEIITGNRDG